MSQQTGTKPAADHQPAKPGDTPGAGEGTPEQMISKVDFDRVDKDRNTVKRENSKLKERIAELEDSLSTSNAKISTFEERLNETYTDEILRAKVKAHLDEVAAHKKDKAAFKKERDSYEETQAESRRAELQNQRASLVDTWGCPANLLADIEDKDQMELIAFKNRSKDPPKPGDTTPAGNGQKPAVSPPLMPGGGAGGPSLKDLPPEERVSRGLARLKNN